MSKPIVFREVFEHARKELLHWFPGHMARGLRVMQQKLREVDGIIEVHDARIPFSGRNWQFKDRLAMVRPHLFILNKMDLADLSRKDEIVAKLKDEGMSEVMFTDCKSNGDSAASQIVPKIADMIKNAPRYGRATTSPGIYRLMVIGVPNVGKSSLINLLRRIHMKKGGKPAAVGDQPGITKTVQTGIRVSHRPNIFILDTPGVAAPNVPDVLAGMKLALCHVLRDHKVGEDIMVDYLLFWLNLHGDFRYVKEFGLQNPTDNVTELLVHVAVTQNFFNIRRPVEGGPMIERIDMITTARWILHQFRAGKLGKIMLDTNYLPYNDSQRRMDFADRQQHVT